MPVLSAVLLIFSFQFNLLFFNAAPVLQRTVGFNTQYRTSDFAENLGRYLSCTERTSQGKDFELILTVKIETRHPVEGPFGSEFQAICNHCGVMTAWSRKTWKFCEQFVRFFLEKRSYQTVATARIAPKICHGQPHIWPHTVPDFIQIGSLSAELLPNAWRPSLLRRIFPTWALRCSSLKSDCY